MRPAVDGSAVTTSALAGAVRPADLDHVRPESELIETPPPLPASIAANRRLRLCGSIASETASYPGGWDPRPDVHVAPPSVLRTIPSYWVPTQIRDAFAGSIRMQNATTSPGRVSRCQVVPPSVER